ncbi:hypothetical protein GCM10012290_14080 [Halolactibacillus alkaliphilus]|uniref:Transcription regulator PadR N-terminal domain-containing protein n=1 Tax=Halolactibacillus alkaliphilus TaxID=442899 RepID=A0A511X549_9BACI|nr:PadR family transcriptional regulator [Halolactibacillus alkaliphilus]GEN58060.1 hypothetical protein HAL01_25240 [Halolactibacillus alkaliphilus]GGN70358.1 hypothetical protein GCM10012290_14080 [Halolactibacillus alkaliphilus]SFO65095.1 Transcriptional regulator PadR-like family protein [Halolactibacillus alkaliphilus]
MDTIPLSYANFLILWVLQTPSHGYEIMKNITEKTKKNVTIGPATIYRSLSYYQENGYIDLISEMDNKKKYKLTASGKELLNKQIEFLTLLYDMTEQERK